MRNIQNLQVTQIRFFQQDTIPYLILARPDKLRILKERFHFTGEQIPFPLHEPSVPKVIDLRIGEAKCDRKSVLFNSLIFTDRRIAMVVGGTSRQADVIFSEIASLLSDMAGKKVLTDKMCLIKVEETACVVGLDIDYWEIFNSATKQFVENKVPSMLKERVTSVFPKNLTFEIAFEQDMHLLNKQGIQIVPKPLTVEPRANVPFEQKIFYTHSPCDSDTHLKLIESLEKLFRKKAAKQR